jgi:hypothetical protein
VKINSANFLTWYNATDADVLPLNEQNCGFGLVAWNVGEDMSFVVNTSVGLPLSGGFTVSLCSTNKTVLSSLSSITHFTSEVYAGNYLYDTIECPTVTEGFYLLKIASSGTTLYSNPIYIINGVNVARTAKFKFRHKFAKNNIDYNVTALADFYQEFRLFCNFNSLEFQLTKDVINDNDSDVPREYNHKAEYQYKVNLLNLSFDEHQAAHDMVSCSELFINGMPMQTVGAYSASRIRKDNRSDGSFSVSDYNLRYNKRV